MHSGQKMTHLTFTEYEAFAEAVRAECVNDFETPG